MSDKPGINCTKFYIELQRDWFEPRVRKPSDWEGIWQDIILFGEAKIEINMEEEKYYTPELDEFHIGFEFEYYNGSEWTKRVFPGLSFLDSGEWVFCLEDCIQRKSVRVKYLTQEDIESLEWKFKAKSVDIWFEKEGSFDMFTWNAHKAIMHYGLHDRKLTVFIDDAGDDYTLFQGECKNKSEFQKIMKQLRLN